jgi:hypothetical protein
MANLLSTTVTGTVNTTGRVVVGGNFSNNPYSSVASTRLHFGGGDADALNNYYIGTNLDNYGGNYTKLDLRWHTGIRMGARPEYGGIRFFNNETLASRIMSIGETDANVRIDNNLWIGGAGGWITDLFNAKQNASTAITTSNIGSQSVNYANSSGVTEFQNIPDARGNAYTPNAYAGQRVWWHFNNTDTVGGYGTYWHAIQTVSPWTSYDSSHRQQQIQWGGTDISFRYATSGTTWSSWFRFITDANIASQSVSYAANAGNLGGLSSSRYPKQDYYSDSSYNWNTIEAADTTAAIVLRIESAVQNPPANDVYNWSLWQQGTRSRGSQIAVAAYGEERIYFRGSNFDTGSYHNWNEIIHSGNISSQSVGYASSAGGVAWTNVSSRPTALSQFTNDSGYVTSSGSVNYASSAGNSSTTSQIVFSDLKINFPSGAGGGHSFGANHYSMGLDSGNGGWDHPHYRDVIIGYHTGIRIGANYSGVRFYNNSPTTDANNDGNGDGGEALLMTIGGYVGTANHTDVVVNNNLFANVSMRAPIFYDSNDTGYYGNFASFSRMSEIGVTNQYVYNYDSIESGRATAEFGNVGRYLSTRSGSGDYPSFSFEHSNGNHSWGTIARYHIRGGSGSDRPSIQFSSGYSNTRWNIGYCLNDDNFRISQNMGYRPDGSGVTDSWGTERFRINTDGSIYISSSLQAYSYQGHSNVAGTGNASYHPSGIYSTGTNWLYGTMYMNNNSIRDVQEIYNNGWFRTVGHQGLYNPTNDAHFYPNNASYGSWRIDGTRNGWHGLHFNSGATLMMNSAECGIHQEAVGWKFRWYNGEMYISANSTGGGTERTVIHSGSIGSQSVNYATSAGSSSSSSRSSALDIVGYGSGNMTYYQSSGTFAGQSGWAGYFISNHGDGATYYNQTIIMPFWGAPQYSRLQGGGAIVGPYTFWTTENLNDYAPNMNQYVRTSDNVTFNTTTAPTILVNNHSDNTKGYRIHNTSGSSVSAMFTNSSNQLVIAAGAVDQINLNKKVYVNGVALGVNVTPSSTAGRIDASNDIVAYSSSDERLKYNITPIENAIDKVKSLTGVEFDWKPEYKHAHGYEGHDTGIIAQQVQEVIPSAVRTNDTGFLAVRYEKLIGLLIEANKELAARVEELEKKLG